MPRLGLAVMALMLFVAARVEAEGLDLKRVVLSTGGVAYLEYETTVTGDADLVFDVRLDQVDDVLKSFIVLDDTGGIGSVSLPGRQPLEQVFRDLPFSQAALVSPVALLQALTGEEVAVTGPVEANGRILAVVREESIADGRSITRHRLTLASPDGLVQVVVEDAKAIRFTDPQIDQQIAEALVAISQHRVADRRELTLSSTGQGERVVRLGYVVAAPLWKTSYRWLWRVMTPRCCRAGQRWKT